MRNILRSILFVPAHKLEFIKKINTVNADAIAFDLEDGVPRDKVKIARINLKEILKKTNKKKFFVRINSLESKLLNEDLKFAIHKNLDGIIIPKISNVQEIKNIEKKVSIFEKKKKLKKKIKFFILIERAIAVVDIQDIAKSSKRIEGLIFGAEDYLSDLGVFELSAKRDIEFPRAVIALVAKAYNLLSIDTPFLNLKDRKGFSKHLKRSKSLGYSGMLNIHPDQCDITNKTFFPSSKEIKIYEKITKSPTNNKTDNIFVHENRMMGPPIFKLAKKLLNFYKKLI